MNKHETVKSKIPHLFLGIMSFSLFYFTYIFSFFFLDSTRDDPKIIGSMVWEQSKIIRMYKFEKVGSEKRHG